MTMRGKKNYFYSLWDEQEIDVQEPVVTKTRHLSEHIDAKCELAWALLLEHKDGGLAPNMLRKLMLERHGELISHEFVLTAMDVRGYLLYYEDSGKCSRYFPFRHPSGAYVEYPATFGARGLFAEVE